MPATAFAHFGEDIARTRAIISHADLLPVGTPAEQLVRSDLLRSAWMFAVGAMDAYFCDAYTDIVAACLISKSRQNGIVLPDFVEDIKLPVRAVLESHNLRHNWRWRMAARRMMAHDHLYDLSKVQTLFNKFFRRGHRFFTDLLHVWLSDPISTARMFGTTRADYLALAPAAQRPQREASREVFFRRFQAIVQRRHDCIHNCDRPHVTPQRLNRPGTVRNVVTDIAFVVQRCEAHINQEFRVFLQNLNVTAANIAAVGY